MNNKLTSTELQSRLLQGNFDRGRSPDERFADPLMETSMIVTLEQLRPYDLNPRLMRNPAMTTLRNRSVIVDWTRHRQSPAVPIRSGSSSPTAAIPACRSSTNCGAKRMTNGSGAFSVCTSRGPVHPINPCWANCDA